MDDIIHDKENHRFYQIIEGQECILQYRIQDDGTLNVYYTYVPEPLRGRMIALELVRTVVKYARDKKIKILPSCSFVAKCFSRHTEWNDLL